MLEDYASTIAMVFQKLSSAYNDGSGESGNDIVCDIMRFVDADACAEIIREAKAVEYLPDRKFKVTNRGDCLFHFKKFNCKPGESWICSYEDFLVLSNMKYWIERTDLPYPLVFSPYLGET